jgi:hypothetical protein
MIPLTKHQWKICEAVQLGLTHYYMWPHDRRVLTQEDYETAYRILPKLPKGWMQNGDKMPWSCFNKK